MDKIEQKNSIETAKLNALPPEEKRNFVGFFELLIKVDKRNNPSLYNNQKENNDRYNLSTDTTQ